MTSPKSDAEIDSAIGIGVAIRIDELGIGASPEVGLGLAQTTANAD